MTEATKPTTEKKSSFTKDLPCVLTREEVEKYGARLADIEDSLSQHREHAKEVKADLKAKEAKLEAERSTVAMRVRTKRETRPVQCEVWADYALNQVSEKRTDTGEVIDARAMTASERQIALGIPEEPKKEPVLSVVKGEGVITEEPKKIEVTPEQVASEIEKQKAKRKPRIDDAPHPDGAPDETKTEQEERLERQDAVNEHEAKPEVGDGNDF